MGKKRRSKPKNQSAEEAALEEILADDLEIAPKRRGGGFLWFLFALLLLAGLAGQYAWFLERDRVLQHPQVRPWLERLCEKAGCVLPMTQDITRFRVAQRYVDRHDKKAGALLTHIVFENSAFFPQPYPVLELMFHDDNTQPVAARRFSPAEYLDDPTRTEMPAGQRVHIKLEFLENVPDMHTYGFTIDFYPSPRHLSHLVPTQSF